MNFNIFAIFLLFTAVSFGQLNEAKLLTNSISSKIDQNKKHKLAKKYCVKKWIYNDTLDILRVPSEKIKSKLSAQIIILQEDLDTAYNCYITKRHIKKNKIENYIFLLNSYDPDWPSVYYSNENNAYLLYEKKLYEQENAARKIANEYRRKIKDSLLLVEKIKYNRINDSLYTVSMKQKEQKKLSEAVNDTNVNQSYSHSKPSLKSTKNKFRSSSGNFQYRTGPRGGCYYLNSNGKKVYVDRSYCK